MATGAAAIMIGQQKQHTEQALISHGKLKRAERNFQQARQIVDRFSTRRQANWPMSPAPNRWRELLGEA